MSPISLDRQAIDLVKISEELTIKFLKSFVKTYYNNMT